MRLRRQLLFHQIAIAVLAAAVLALAGFAVSHADRSGASGDSAMAATVEFEDRSAPLTYAIDGQAGKIAQLERAVDTQGERLERMDRDLDRVGETADQAARAADEAYTKALEPCLIHRLC